MINWYGAADPHERCDCRESLLDSVPLRKYCESHRDPYANPVDHRGYEIKPAYFADTRVQQECRLDAPQEQDGEHAHA